MPVWVLIRTLTFGQNILGLTDALVSDLGNVDQTINAGQDLCECTEGHQLHNLSIDNIADVVTRHELDRKSVV